MVGSNGSELASVINAVYSAVRHARLPVKAPIFAATFAIGEELVEAPTEEQEEEAEAVVTIGVVPGTDLIVLSHCTNMVGIETYKNCVSRTFLKQAELTS